MSGNTKPVAAAQTGTLSPVAAFKKMAAAIPDAGDDGIDGLIKSILGAESPEQLSDSWESENTEALNGRTIRIDALRKAPSDFQDGLGLFLIVDYTDPRDGAQGTFTTGSTAVVLQLVKAHAEGWLPLDVEVQKAKRPTEAGYYPMHLKILGVSWKEG